MKLIREFKYQNLLGVIMNIISRNEDNLNTDYLNKSITVESGSGDLIIQLAEYRATFNVDELLSIPSISHLQWGLQVKLFHNHRDLSQQDTAIISALMIQKLQEEEYIKDTAPPV